MCSKKCPFTQSFLSYAGVNNIINHLLKTLEIFYAHMGKFTYIFSLLTPFSTQV